MHIKRFEATTMAEALRQVRKEFGADALVLSTRSVHKSKGIFGRLARPVVEVTAAVDREVLRSPQGQASGGSRVPARRPDPTWQELRLSRALIEPLEAEVRDLRHLVEDLTSSIPTGLSVAQEIAELRSIARNAAASGAGVAGPESAGFLAAGLAPRHAFALGTEVAREMRGVRIEPQLLRRTLARRLDSQILLARADDSPILMVVGPTGVGKTTTVAKVAARESLGRKDLSLLTTDAHRFGSLAALRSFATGLALPFDVAVSAESLAEKVRNLGRGRLFVDTAGHSRSDRRAVPELMKMRDALGARGRVHLVVSATTKEADLRAEIQRYAPLAPDALVVTKVDESDELGNIVNVLLDERTPPLAWIGNGQNVPEDLEVPDPESLAGRILGVAA